MPRRRHMPKRQGSSAAKVMAAGCASLLSACTSNPYVIGSLSVTQNGAGDGGGGDTDAQSVQGLTFAADLDRSGVSLLDDALALPSGPLAATLRLRGEQARADAWPAESGANLTRAAGLAITGREAPFTDA